jgi:transposase
MVLLESSRDNRVLGINEIVLLNDLNQQGLSVLAIAQQVGYDRKTVKKYIERSLEARYDGLRAA